ncbi:Peptide/nickel transport system permease protein/oligopeptide transport system permease protein OS=Streptomyces violarus OX=67380 GN=FHS41_002446 PE=3 SV=1 [Streptomyces violarus]
MLARLAGFFGGGWDAILSRITDVFFGIPVVLGGLVLLSVVTSNTVWPVVGFIVLLGWPQIARIARGSVITAKQNDYVQAARALGASNSRLMLRQLAERDRAGHRRGDHRAGHVHLAGGDPVLPRRRPEGPAVSWGIDISAAANYIRNAPHVLLWPAGVLAVTVLAFIMLGDAVRDALDPKLR